MGNSPSKKEKPNKKKPAPVPPSSPPPPISTSSHPSSSSHHTDDKSHIPSAPYSSSPSVDAPPPVSQHSRSDSDNNKGGFSAKKLEELFDKYKGIVVHPCSPVTLPSFQSRGGADNLFIIIIDEDGQIGPTGVEQLCKDIGVDPEDVLVLVFAWHLNAQRMGFFSKEEFLSGMQKLGVDNIAKLKAQLNSFKRDLDDQIKFKEIYRFAFVFAKEKESKVLDLGTSDALLALVLGSRYPHTEPLRQFLKEQTTYKSINQDQWMNILEFSKSIKIDLSNYDENSAWPVLLDEYCEWAKKI